MPVRKAIDMLGGKALMDLSESVMRTLLNQKEEIGVSPYELRFRGRKRTEKVQLHMIDYGPEGLQEHPVATIEEVLALQHTGSVSWFNIDGVHDERVMDSIAKGFGFESLVLADAMNTFARPKLVEHAGCLFVSIKMLREHPKSRKVDVENLSLILTKNMLISFQERSGDVFEPIRERIRAQKRRIRNSGPDYLLFALLDIVVDNYIFVIGSLGLRIEELENGLLEDPAKSVIEDIYAFKRELNSLRKSILPAREMILNLSKLESEFIEGKNEVHFKELVDNINQATDSTNSYREILSDQLTIYHTTISSKLNDTMKFLTVFSVIFIPLTFIAGLYGTNFDHIPELHYQYGYYAMLGVMLVVAVLMLYYFKRNRWL